MDSKRKRTVTHKGIVSDLIESASSSSEDDFATLKVEFQARAIRSVKPVVHGLPGRQDLVVNKSKVDAVDAWLRENHQSSRLLLLSGPSGAGKTATLHTLAVELDVQVFEWLNPLDQNRDHNGQTYDHNYVNQATQFEDFLLSSGRYSSVFQPTMTKKLILVEEYPNTFNLRPELFHNIIQRYVTLGRCPIVFITSEPMLSLFSPAFMADVGIEQISFLAVSRTALGKAIDRIAKLEGRDDVSYDIRDAVCDAAHGDIRNAAIGWRYHTTGLTAASRPAFKRPSKKRTKQKDTKKNDLVMDGKDELNEFLPSVGRVLYAKRLGDERGTFKTDPQQVVDKFSSEANKFLALAHENYVTIFSDIHSVKLAADWLSSADVILNEWRDENSCRELGFSVGVRGLMNSCHKPVLKFAPLRKSRLRQTALRAEEHVGRVKSVYARNSSSTQALLLDIIPLTAALRNNPYSGIVSASPGELSEPASPQPIIDEDSDSS